MKRRLAAGPRSFPACAPCALATGQRNFVNAAMGWGLGVCRCTRIGYAWAERASKCGCQERFAQLALGHNSKAVHHAYSTHAEATVPSRDDWEKDWGKNSRHIPCQKPLPLKSAPFPKRPGAELMVQSNHLNASPVASSGAAGSSSDDRILNIGFSTTGVKAVATPSI